MLAWAWFCVAIVRVNRETVLTSFARSFLKTAHGKLIILDLVVFRHPTGHLLSYWTFLLHRIGVSKSCQIENFELNLVLHFF